MMRVALSILPAFALAACSGEDAGTGPVAGGESPAATASATAVAEDGKAEALKVSEDNDLYSFDYAYPAEVDAIPELRARLDGELADGKAKLQAQAQEAREEARDQGFPYNAYAEGTEWKVVADTPRYLSLSAEIYSYTGGAHPNSGSTALVWDRETKRALKPLDFFTSADALGEAVKDGFCAALDKERAKRRGEDAEMGIDEFARCPAIGELTVLLGSSNGKGFNRIGFIADPYVAGPYAEGNYDITVPVTAEVIEAVRPAYREAFAVR